jgi:hypothetical protein
LGVLGFSELIPPALSLAVLLARLPAVSVLAARALDRQPEVAEDPGVVFSLPR